MKLKRTVSALVCPGTPPGALTIPQPVKRSKSTGGLDAFRQEEVEEDWGWFASFSQEESPAAAVSRPPGGSAGVAARAVARYERGRLASLAGTRCFGTPSEAAFDAVTRRVTDVFGAPIAFVTLVGDTCQHVKSVSDRLGLGLANCVVPREGAICSYACAHASRLAARGECVDAVYAIPDTTRHAEIATYPWVRHAPFVRSYFGVPLRLGGFFVGMLCVVDIERADAVRKPIRRGLAANEAAALVALADVVVRMLHEGAAAAAAA